jgi:hypothetical protein
MSRRRSLRLSAIIFLVDVLCCLLFPYLISNHRRKEVLKSRTYEYELTVLTEGRTLSSLNVPPGSLVKDNGQWTMARYVAMAKSSLKLKYVAINPYLLR